MPRGRWGAAASLLAPAPSTGQRVVRVGGNQLMGHRLLENSLHGPGVLVDRTPGKPLVNPDVTDGPRLLGAEIGGAFHPIESLDRTHRVKERPLLGSGRAVRPDVVALGMFHERRQEFHHRDVTRFDRRPAPVVEPFCKEPVVLAFGFRAVESSEVDALPIELNIPLPCGLVVSE